MRRNLRELYEKLSKNREKYAAGGDGEDIAAIIQDANRVLSDVRGTQEAMEDAKMFKLLCQTVHKQLWKSHLCLFPLDFPKAIR